MERAQGRRAAANILSCVDTATAPVFFARNLNFFFPLGQT
jgi:hypothetical protein